MLAMRSELRRCGKWVAIIPALKRIKFQLARENSISDEVCIMEVGDDAPYLTLCHITHQLGLDVVGISLK
ncbi:hypothetical protein V476_21790 [Pseudomonas syringae KCTC 12500]|nr:hypothetical protein V476_21790 [Pseudomonas syringae KCTC 12500]POR85135.1 hypothetical protein BKM21_14020 [Pseudomonas syringae pv. syringae]